jgi:hypothetical protein
VRPWPGPPRLLAWSTSSHRRAWLRAATAS